MSDWSDEAIDRLLWDLNDTIERLGPIWYWHTWVTDYTEADGWTFTRRGAVRAIRRAKGSV